MSEIKIPTSDQKVAIETNLIKESYNIFFDFVRSKISDALNDCDPVKAYHSEGVCVVDLTHPLLDDFKDRIMDKCQFLNECKYQYIFRNPKIYIFYKKVDYDTFQAKRNGIKVCTDLFTQWKKLKNNGIVKISVDKQFIGKTEYYIDMSEINLFKLNELHNFYIPLFDINEFTQIMYDHMRRNHTGTRHYVLMNRNKFEEYNYIIDCNMRIYTNSVNVSDLYIDCPQILDGLNSPYIIFLLSHDSFYQKGLAESKNKNGQTRVDLVKDKSESKVVQGIFSVAKFFDSKMGNEINYRWNEEAAKLIK